MKELSRRFLRVLLCTALVAGLLCGLAVMAAAKTVDYYEVDPETGMMTAGTMEVEEEDESKLTESDGPTAEKVETEE